MCLGAVGVIERVWDEDGVPMATVATASEPIVPCLLLVAEARPGAPVLVHLGFVVELLDSEVADQAMALRRQVHDGSEEL